MGVSPHADSEQPLQAEPHRGTAPRVAAVGGGTGLPNVLRGLRPVLFADAAAPRERLVAIVATSDDGGSSGRLRAEFNVIPPGDIRNCLAALSDNHAQIADLFQYRFGGGDGLNGHAIGNLVLTALADVTNDFAQAVEIASRVIGARGVVLPATSELVTLVAEFTDGRLEMSLSQPVSRGAVVVERMATLIASALVIAAASGVALYYASHTQGIDLKLQELAGRVLIQAVIALKPFNP